MNAWGELAGIVGGALVSLIYITPWAESWTGLAYYQQLLFTVGFTTVLTLITVFLTQPERPDVLEAFVKRVSPPGLWPYEGTLPPPPILRLLALWLASAVALFGSLFGIGEILLSTEPGFGWAVTAISLAAWVVIFRKVQLEWTES